MSSSLTGRLPYKKYEYISGAIRCVAFSSMQVAISEENHRQWLENPVVLTICVILVLNILRNNLQVFKRKKSSLEEETSRYPKVFSGSVQNEEH